MPATVTLSGTTVLENPEAGTVIGILGVSGAADGETFTFALDDSIGQRFEIVEDADTGAWQLVVKAGGSLFDFENGALNDFQVSISATSTETSGGTNVRDTSFTITVDNENEAPTGLNIIGGLISEDALVGSDVVTLYGVDPDAGETFSYILTDANGTSVTDPFFEIVGDKIKLKAGLDQAQVGMHTLWVKVTDHNDLSFLKQITVTVFDSLETITGTAKNDKLYGTANGDFISGGAGKDKIYGFGGDDFINGGSGKDILYGGAGKDTFIFDTKVKKGQFDQIKDFSAADDTLQFSLAAFSSFKVKGSKNELKKGKPDDKGGKPSKKSTGFDDVFKKGKLEKKFFKVGSKAKDSNDFITYDKKKGFVYFDADGAGGKKGIEILKIKPGTTLTVDDFLFI